MIEQLLIKPNSEDQRDIVSQCCVCKDWVSNEGTYISLDDQQSKSIYAEYLVSHGYCEPCMQEVLKDGS